MGAVNVKLTPEDVQQIRHAAVEADQTLGLRYPEAYMALVMADTPPL